MVEREGDDLSDDADYAASVIQQGSRSMYSGRRSDPSQEEEKAQPLCRKTVDEVWTEIQRTQRQEQQVNQQHAATTSVNSDAKHQRQPTFGEMTLEDFLVKAGVVREPCVQPPPPPLSSVVPQHHHNAYGFTNSHTQLGPSFVTQPMMGITPSAYGDDSCGFAANGKRGNNGFSASTVAGYGGRVTNAGPPSPMSPDGMCGAGQVDNSAAQYGLDMAAVLRGRKRIIDGPVEKVVERRQRRMIKNRESAARSRARKQAYTVELEAELNQLREENTQLKQALVPADFVQQLYVPSSRELIRLAGIATAPIMHHFTETMSGIAIIRCFGHERRFCETSQSLINGHLRPDFYRAAAIQWLLVTIDSIL